MNSVCIFDFSMIEYLLYVFLTYTYNLIGGFNMDYNNQTPDYNQQSQDFNKFPPQNNNGSNGYAVASLILGILSIPLGCCYGAGIVLAVLGIIFGILSRKYNYGKIPAMSIAGIICSVFGILVSLFMIVCIVIAFTQFSSGDYNQIFQQYLQDPSSFQ